MNTVAPTVHLGVFSIVENMRYSYADVSTLAAVVPSISTR